MSLKSLNIKNKLYDAPQGEPKYSTQITDAGGNTVTLADPKANRVLLALMDLAAVNGGAACHWGGPAALAEMMSAVHSKLFANSDWYNHFNFINDVGHGENGIYALRANLGFGDLTLESLKGFRSIDSKLTGHGEAHLYPEGVLMSNGPLGSSLGQAQGLAMADKALGNNRVTISVLSDGASMEGEAKEAFAAIAGFAKKGQINPFILIISDNKTKLSGRIPEDSFDMNESFNAMTQLGWHVLEVEKGNDLQTCYHSFEEALKLADGDKPICIRLKTVKGFSVRSTEEHSAGGHGFPIKAYSEDIHNFIKEIWGSGDLPEEFKNWASQLTEKPQSDNKSSNSQVVMEKAQAGFSRACSELAKQGYPIVSISSDLQGSTGMAAFRSEFPKNSFDVGIAESNMVSVGAGFSKQGFIPVVDTFSAFGVTKGNLPLIMSSLSNAPMIAVFSHTGFQDAADGASHQSLTYLSAVASIPQVDIVCVSSSKEAYEYMKIAIKEFKTSIEAGKTPNSTLFFVGRENFPSENIQGLDYSWNQAQLLAKGSSATIVATGPMVVKAQEAASKLREQNIEVSVINFPFINSGNLELVKEQLANTNGKLITVEDHQIIGGLGAQISHRLLLDKTKFELSSLAVKGKFGQSAYKADHLYKLHGLDAESIAQAVKSLL